MRNRRLREFDTLLNVEGAQADVFAEGVPTLFFKSLQNSTAGGISDRVEESVEVRGGERHDEEE